MCVNVSSCLKFYYRSLHRTVLWTDASQNVKLGVVWRRRFRVKVVLLQKGRPAGGKKCDKKSLIGSYTRLLTSCPLAHYTTTTQINYSLHASDCYSSVVAVTFLLMMLRYSSVAAVTLFTVTVVTLHFLLFFYHYFLYFHPAKLDTRCSCHSCI